MKAEYINAHGISVAYLIHNPRQLQTIYFIHGNSSSSNTWRRQVSDLFFREFRLVTIDLPNHGESGAIDAGGDFSLPAVSRIIAAVIQELDNGHPYIICSISLGTNIVAEMLPHGIKPVGLFFAGPCIVGDGFEIEKMLMPGADVTAVFSDGVNYEQVLAYANTSSASLDETDKQDILKDYFSVKGLFRSSLFATVLAHNYSDQIKILAKYMAPICIVFGEYEKVINPQYLNGAALPLWHQRVFAIPGAGHLVNIDNPAKFNELLAEFAKDIFTTAGF